MEQFRKTSAIIHLENLAHNVRELRAAAGSPPFFCPMIKANAYGHGDIEIGARLEAEGVTHVGVALIEEGISLRQKGLKIEILVFGLFDSKGAPALVENKLTPVLSSWDQLRSLEAVAPAGYPVHVKFDTGMHRLGFSVSDISKVVTHFQSSKLKIMGILTHLHTGENASDLTASTFQQLELFQQVERAFKPWNPVSHTLNSSGLLLFQQHQGKQLPHGISSRQGVRPGLSLYGVASVPTPVKLKPVMSLRSEANKYHVIQPGDGVSYNLTWRAAKESVVAIIPLGYADGYHRLLSNRGTALFRGKRVPIVGNVCMDFIMADITDTLKNETADSLKPEKITLFGWDEFENHLSAEELAKVADTIPYEILTSISERVPRIPDGKSYVKKGVRA